MQLDRSRGGEIDHLLRTASYRARKSAAEATKLLTAGCPGPAYVWAVRSIEIFVKEIMLLPLFLEESTAATLDEAWAEAWAKVRRTFQSGRWNRALRLVDERYGPLEGMLTESGEDVWQVWKSQVVPRRGDIVHGVPHDPSPDEARVVIHWAEQMMQQLVMRLIVARRHPLHDLFTAALDAARVALPSPPAESE